MNKKVALIAALVSSTTLIHSTSWSAAPAPARDIRPSLLDQIQKGAEEEAKKALAGILQPKGDGAATEDKGNIDNAPPAPVRTPPPAPVRTPPPVPVRTPPPAPTPVPRTALSPKSAPVPAPSPVVIAKPSPVPLRPSRPKEVVRNDGPIIMQNADLPHHVEGEVLLFIRDPQNDLSALIAANGLRVLTTRRIDVLDITMVRGKLADADSVNVAVTRLNQENAIAWAQPNYIYQLLGNSRSRGLAMHGLDSESSLLPTGLPAVSSSAKIVLIDSPVDEGHTNLADANISQVGILENASPSPHGTAIAELLVGGGTFEGVARGAQLISIPAFKSVDADDWHSPSTSTSDYLIAAFQTASEAQPDVMNLSFGTLADDDEALGKMISRLQSDGICMASAAGNGGANSPVLFPAKLPETIAVAAVDANEDAYAFGSRGPEIDISAWGVDISAAVPGGRRIVSGTSFATALVAGAMIRMPACSGARRADTVRAAFALDAKDLGDDGKDTVFGAGLLRFGEAVLASATQEPDQGADNGQIEQNDSSISPIVIGGGVAAGSAGLFFLLWRRRKKQQTSHEN